MHKHEGLGNSVIKAFMDFKKAEMHHFKFEGLSEPETRFLFILFHFSKQHKGDIRVSDLGKYLHISRPSVTPTLQSLENKGLVVRRQNPADKRTRHVVLSPAGQKLLNNGMKRLENNFNDMKDFLGEENLKTLIDLLNQLTNYLREKAEEREEL